MPLCGIICLRIHSQLLFHQQSHAEAYPWLQPNLVRTPESHHPPAGTGDLEVMSFMAQGVITVRWPSWIHTHRQGNPDAPPVG